MAALLFSSQVWGRVWTEWSPQFPSYSRAWSVGAKDSGTEAKEGVWLRASGRGCARRCTRQLPARGRTEQPREGAAASGLQTPPVKMARILWDA
ncbi:hypothetical protein CB1_000211002 [Camelus ferus]|nr:hypothetical protein CB1_000211002 [Camelus ferus]